MIEGTGGSISRKDRTAAHTHPVKQETMTDLPRFLLDWACSCLLFLAAYVHNYCKIRRRGRHHHMAATTAASVAPSTPAKSAGGSSPTPAASWNKRASCAEQSFPGEPVPAAKRFKDDGDLPAAPVPAQESGAGGGDGNDGIGIERQCTGAQRPPAEGGDAQPPKKGTPALLLRRRPSMIVIPEESASSAARKEFEKEAAARKLREEEETAANSCSITEGDGYCVAARKGSRRPLMEDGHDAITCIHGDPKQAYFGVFDGHGGRAAVDFVERNLARNVVAALAQQTEQLSPADAIRSAYAATDKDFVKQNLCGGACVATVVLKDNVIHAANAGDCRVVLSRGGEARRLTDDHRATRGDERRRIESTGGFVSCYGGGAVWRVQDSLSVTRSIGDAQLKQWIIPDPEISEFTLPQGHINDDFLILASDGLWDHVADREAVDLVLTNGGCGSRAARALADVPFARGGRDDVTVMLVQLRRFVQ